MRETIITVWKDGRFVNPAWSGLPADILPESADGWNREEWDGMTLIELSREYADTAAALRERIRVVEALREQEKEESRRLLLDHRLRLLRSMFRDTRALSVHLEHYYERGISRNANYIL